MRDFLMEAAKMITKEKNQNDIVQKLFSVGAHFGLIRSRRHPSVKSLIFGTKNKVEIFDLEKTVSFLEDAKKFATQVGSEGGTILFVGGKNEAQAAIRSEASALSAPYVAGRWLGGTLTNFSEIKKRIQKLDDLLSQKDKGELAKYTKKERLLIDREIDYLQEFFSGISSLRSLPKAIFLIDPKRESVALREAKKLGVPVIALMSSDCNMREVDYPIPGNDASKASIEFFVGEIAKAYEEGKRNLLQPNQTENR